jgi:hypothetical protein
VAANTVIAGLVPAISPVRAQCPLGGRDKLHRSKVKPRGLANRIRPVAGSVALAPDSPLRTGALWSSAWYLWSAILRRFPPGERLSFPRGEGHCIQMRWPRLCEVGRSSRHPRALTQLYRKLG